MGQVKSRNKPKHAETAWLGAETSRPPYRGGWFGFRLSVFRLSAFAVAADFFVWSKTKSRQGRMNPHEVTS